MESNKTSSTNEPTLRPSVKARTAWLLLTAVIAYFCLVDGLEAIGLVGPDEPRYAAIARDMAVTGDWVTPKLHGKPWFEKPILYYWTAAAQYKIWGDSEFAARLPSVRSAILTTVVLGWLAWQAYGWSAAAIVLLLFPTTVAAIGFGRAATPDMEFAASLALAMTAATRIVRPDRSPAVAEETVYGAANAPRRRGRVIAILWRLGLGAAIGMAALAKGPAALVLAGGSVAMWTLATRRWRDGFATLHPWALVALAIVALPWYVLCAARNPEFVDVFLISHNLDRFLTPVFQHQQPWWFFGPVLLVALAPWTPLLAGSVHDGITAVREKRWTQSPSFFFACWAAFPVLFFSLSKSKLPGYILPAIPALALLMARSLSKTTGENAKRARWLQLGVAVMLLLLAVGTALPGFAEAKLPGVSPPALRALAVLAAVGGLVAAYFSFRGGLLRSVAATAVTVALLVGIINRTVLPALDAQISPRAAAGAIESAGAKDAVFAYRIHRAWHYGLNYYLHREIPEWPQAVPAWVVTTEAGREELAQRGLRTVAAPGDTGRVLLIRVEAPQ